mmetsp:Transcript_3718/g.10908  ORF Transcript_3718/g.10908 Transcript_3718/m.10908 type:complete len:174 (+) Transcript_3718:228-749(+)|eukprot:CAMPEP_0119000336 /NCGR_PEP_ID=MMETSP1173-20130426/64029_1 /TAXON_ID=1034831 /ORGANISM="Rhizochromulina marina cf, Strain CCMP1243" /LENGTH=173 /DNA_ID=CAMNT_0006951839 /DNA_START=224 /DNA_END=745 /DNA_ORIENTATION=-
MTPRKPCDPAPRAPSVHETVVLGFLGVPGEEGSLSSSVSSSVSGGGTQPMSASLTNSSISSGGSKTPPVNMFSSSRRNAPVPRRRAASLPMAVPAAKSVENKDGLDARKQADRTAASCMYFEAKTRSMASRLVKAGIALHSGEEPKEPEPRPTRSLPRRDSSSENLGVFALED